MLENGGKTEYSALREVKFRYSIPSRIITPGTEITVFRENDDSRGRVGFISSNINSTALGNINGHTGDDITLSGFTDSTLNGKKILAVERWWNLGGWARWWHRYRT